jgi:hypothetical protein
MYRRSGKGAGPSSNIVPAVDAFNPEVHAAPPSQAIRADVDIVSLTGDASQNAKVSALRGQREKAGANVALDTSLRFGL